MLSKEIKQSKWQGWLPLNKGNRITVKNIERVPKKLRGVYIIKQNKAFRRIKGESDIIYIGQGKVQDRLWAITGCFFKEGKNWHHTAKEEIYRLIREENKRLKFAFYITKKCKMLEDKFLKKYEKDHIELPPLNKSIGAH